MATPNLPEGILIPVPTPFDDELRVDEQALSALVAFYLARDPAALFILGTYGMGPALSVDERRAVAELVIAETKGRAPVIVHTGTADTANTVALTRHAVATGAAAVAVIPPYYYPHTEGEVTQHYIAAAAAAEGLPMLVYDNPPLCNFSFRPAFLRELVKACPSIGGLKIAYTDADVILGYTHYAGADFRLYAGWPSLIRARGDFSIAGVINPTTSSVPEAVQALWSAPAHGAVAERLQHAVNEFVLTMGALGKRLGRGAQGAALRCRGLPVRRFPRWPVPAIASDDQALLQSAVDALLAKVAAESPDKPSERLSVSA